MAHLLQLNIPLTLKTNNMTAVEWLLYHFDEIYHIKDKFLPSDWEFLEETSKAMEKEQNILIYRRGYIDGVGETQLTNSVIKNK